jgi:hypothetical protein
MRRVAIPGNTGSGHEAGVSACTTSQPGGVASPAPANRAPDGLEQRPADRFGGRRLDPRARLVPLGPPPPRVAGLHPGALQAAPDFDAPLPDDSWAGQS